MLGEPDRHPTGMSSSRLAWLEFGASQLGSGVVAASISLGSFSACTFQSQLLHCGVSRLFSPAPCLPPAANPLGTSLGDSHGSKTLPGCGGLVPFGAQQNQTAQNPTFSSGWAFGGAGGWWTRLLTMGWGARLGGGTGSEQPRDVGRMGDLARFPIPAPPSPSPRPLPPGALTLMQRERGIYGRQPSNWAIRLD